MQLLPPMHCAVGGDRDALPLLQGTLPDHLPQAAHGRG